MNNFKYKYKKYKYKYKYHNYKFFLQNGGGIYPIKSFPSTYNKIIYVKKAKKPGEPDIMIFGNDVDAYQSMYDINDVDKIYLDYLYPMITFIQYVNLNNLLMIGLGGGHISMLIRKNFPSCQIDIIELDEMVLMAAKEMGFISDSKMNIFVGDGKIYCDNMMNKNYDCIFIDIPDYLNLNIKNIKENMNTNGILVINDFTCRNINTYNRSIINKCEYIDNFTNKLSKYFKCIILYNTAVGNFVWLCSKSNDNTIFNKPLNKDTISPNMKKMKYIDDILKKINSIPFEIITN